MSAIDRVRIMVLGDSGVGKTSFVHLAVNNEPLKAPSWTIGCSVEVKLHEYKEGTPGQMTYFVELWDVGGSKHHCNTRHVFYNPCHGVILIHDLTNKKSENNLREWLHELMDRDTTRNCSGMAFGEFDTENFIGTTNMPILVVGNKLDLVDDKKITSRTSPVSTNFAADEILVDSTHARYLAAATTNAVKLSRFFDKVIETHYHSKSPSPYTDRFSPYSAALSSKFYSIHQD